MHRSVLVPLDLVAIGAHDRAEHAHPALGRVSLAVVQRSPHPVLVVPARTRAHER